MTLASSAEGGSGQGGASSRESVFFLFSPAPPLLLLSRRMINPASSKASSTEEMRQASTYGFRGEALYSLGLTSLLEIQSRCAGKESYAKVWRLHGSCSFRLRKKCPLPAKTFLREYRPTAHEKRKRCPRDYCSAYPKTA